MVPTPQCDSLTGTRVTVRMPPPANATRFPDTLVPQATALLEPTRQGIAAENTGKKKQEKGKEKKRRALNTNGPCEAALYSRNRVGSPVPRHPQRRKSSRRRRRRRSSSYVGGNCPRPPRRGAQGLAQEPPARTRPSILPPPYLIPLRSRRLICSAAVVLLCAGFRREAGDAARRDGEPDDLALYHPRQAGGKRPGPQEP